MMDSLLSWLMTPLSGATAHDIANWTAWHARLMVLSWGILMPIGVFAARFYKVLPKQDWPEELDNRTWWNAHRWVQGIAVLCMTVGLALALGAGRGEGVAVRAHAALGWSLCIAGWIQVLAGVLRGSKGGPTDASLRGDHYDMSSWRRWFERIHKGLGWAAIVVAIPTIAFGLHVSDAPRWMAGVLIVWWTGLLVWFVRLQLHGRCIDTYQAIWGPEDVHPGNRLRPIGWGVRRYTAISWSERSRSRRTQSH
jgi:hypothetical protein